MELERGNYIVKPCSRNIYNIVSVFINLLDLGLCKTRHLENDSSLNVRTSEYMNIGQTGPLLTSDLLHGLDFLNTLRPRQNGRHFPDDIFICIFLNENAWILIKISLKFVPKGPVNKIPALVQIMAWCRSGDKPLSEPMMVSLLTHICVTQPQWVKE